MNCRILHALTLKSDGHIACADSNGYNIILGEVSDKSGWNVRTVLEGSVYQHVRRSFANGVVPWPGVCESCDLFMKGSPFPSDDLLAALTVRTRQHRHRWATNSE